MEPTQFIVASVSTRENVDEMDLPPLYKVIDPDVLNAFIDSPADASATIEFTYYGYDIIVSGDGTILVNEQVAGPVRSAEQGLTS